VLLRLVVRSLKAIQILNSQALYLTVGSARLSLIDPSVVEIVAYESSSSSSAGTAAASVVSGVDTLLPVFR
jgi:hypothetical protein